MTATLALRCARAQRGRAILKMENVTLSVAKDLLGTRQRETRFFAGLRRIEERDPHPDAPPEGDGGNHETPRQPV
ncbi:MAG: hypothetical protein KatS3mg110_0021 [Pirellulaceae bacterium]|nr:MAG: hypothetical protein KatS3mg110_0021 [Pirellulaceae bacterium]